MQTMKKLGLYVLGGLLVIIFRAFVAMKLWNWFIPEVFHVSEISFLQAVGVFLVIRAFAGFKISQPDDKFWKEISETTEEKLRAEINDLMFSQFLWLAVILGVGFVIHAVVG